MPSTTASAAPAFTPRMPGSASGLRAMPCMPAPASPSAAPISRPATVRGTRECTTAWSPLAASKFVSASHTVCGAIGRAPTSSERNAAASSAASNTRTRPAGRSARRRTCREPAGADPGFAVAFTALDASAVFAESVSGTAASGADGTRDSAAAVCGFCLIHLSLCCCPEQRRCRPGQCPAGVALRHFSWPPKRPLNFTGSPRVSPLSAP